MEAMIGNGKARLLLVGAVLVAGVSAVASAGSESSSVTSRPSFGPLPAASSISRLNTPGLAALPRALTRATSGRSVAPADVHALGYGAYAWQDSQQVCVWMPSGSGGCFYNFTAPTVMYLSGSTSSSGDITAEVLEGVVPDSVSSLVFSLNGDRSRPVRIEGNAFRLDLEPGDAIVGEHVTLSDGTSFFYTDPLSAPSHERG
jgi:hypothetical protein